MAPTKNTAQTWRERPGVNPGVIRPGVIRTPAICGYPVVLPLDKPRPDLGVSLCQHIKYRWAELSNVHLSSHAHLPRPPPGSLS